MILLLLSNIFLGLLQQLIIRGADLFDRQRVFIFSNFLVAL